MKLLFDENLPPKLSRLLATLFPQSQHVRECGLRFQMIVDHERDIRDFGENSWEAILILSR